MLERRDFPARPDRRQVMLYLGRGEHMSVRNIQHGSDDGQPRQNATCVLYRVPAAARHASVP